MTFIRDSALIMAGTVLALGGTPLSAPPKPVPTKADIAESLKKPEELLPLISQWSPDALLNKDAPPIYFENEWGLTKPDKIEEANYRVHSPAWALGFQKIARERGAACYVKFPEHPSEKYADIWEFLVQQVRPEEK